MRTFVDKKIEMGLLTNDHHTNQQFLTWPYKTVTFAEVLLQKQLLKQSPEIPRYFYALGWLTKTIETAFICFELRCLYFLRIVNNEKSRTNGKIIYDKLTERMFVLKILLHSDVRL